MPAVTDYAAFLETLPDAVVVVDGEGRVRLLNALARQLLGVPGPDARLEVGDGVTRQALRRFDGATVTVEARVAPVTLDGAPHRVATLRRVPHDDQLLTLVRLGNIGVFEHDHLAGVVNWSAEQRVNCGFGADEVVSLERYLSLVVERDRARLTQAVARCHDPRGTGHLDVEFGITRPDGTPRTAWVRAVTLFDGAGAARRPVLTIGVEVDISARARTETELRTWHHAIEGAMSGLAIADLEGRLTWVNRAFVRMWGLTGPAQAVGRSALDFWAEPARAAEVVAGLGKRPTWAGDLVARRSDGSTFPVLFSASVIFDGAGKPEQLMASFVDLTERQRAEAERARLAALLDATPDVVALLDPQGRIRYLNHAGRALRGLDDTDSLEGVTFEGVVAPEERTRLRELGLPTALASGLWWDELTLNEPGGKASQFSVVIQSFKAPGLAPGLSIVARDITAQRALEAQLRQSQKMEAVGRLAGGVAHDFNNLLTVINANSELLLSDPELPASMREDVEMVHSAGASAASLTRQLLAFSRKQVLQPVLLDLNELMVNVERMLCRVIGEDIQLVSHRAPGLWTTRIDRGQMEQVLVNLAVNARDAMPKGGKLTLETGNVMLDDEYAARHPEVKAGEYVLLAVSDNGVGMEREVLQKVFEPFFTTKGARGTGLGLSTVYGIVRQLGGHVGVYSEPGHGTTFKLYFPRAQGAPAPLLDAPRPPKREREPGTILVVEDSDGVRELVRKFLEGRGHRVLSAARGEDALELAREHAGPIALLVTDVVMPGMGGRELAEALTRVRPLLKVLFMSGYTENAIVHHGVLDAGLSFIAKPFAIDAFADAVDALL